MEHVQTKTAVKRMPLRVAGLAFAALLQAGFIWALVAGLQMKDITKFIAEPFKIIIDQKPIKPPENPVTVKTVEPHEVVVPVPPIDIAPDRGPDVITAQPFNPGIHPALPGDRGPVSVAATHTIPPYPPLDIRLGNQGTVLLRLLVGTDGRVMDAQILRSSGAPGLDRAAQAWVIAHWRYQPALRGGAPAQGAVDVAVKFDLKNAG